MWPRIIIGAATCATISLALALVLFLRGCANEHYRPHGHIDISFGISPRDDMLVFNAIGEGGRDLYLLNLTNLRVSRIASTPSYEVDPRIGTGLRQLTNDDWMASAPIFPPDGKNILFSGMGGLYTIATDGSGSPRSVGDLNGRDAVYAPDGQSVAFSMGRYSPDQRIFVARADGSRPKMVAHPSGDPGVHPRGGCTRPAFTHDGKRLIFFEESWPDGSTGDPKESLWEIDLEGGKPRQIAGYGLFANPLNWRSELPKPAERP